MPFNIFFPLPSPSFTSRIFIIHSAPSLLLSPLPSASLDLFLFSCARYSLLSPFSHAIQHFSFPPSPHSSTSHTNKDFHHSFFPFPAIHFLLFYITGTSLFLSFSCYTHLSFHISAHSLFSSTLHTTKICYHSFCPFLHVFSLLVHQWIFFVPPAARSQPVTNIR